MSLKTQCPLCRKPVLKIHMIKVQNVVHLCRTCSKRDDLCFFEASDDPQDVAVYSEDEIPSLTHT